MCRSPARIPLSFCLGYETGIKKVPEGYLRDMAFRSAPRSRARSLEFADCAGETGDYTPAPSGSRSSYLLWQFHCGLYSFNPALSMRKRRLPRT
jgi:hypothetical protein